MVSASEATEALVAFEGLLALVDEHVSLELVAVREARHAKLACVGPLSGVDAQVSPEVGHLDELAIAMVAVVRLFARMQAHVCFQVMVTREALVALATLKRLLARMGPLVVLQDVLVAEASLANWTNEHFLPSWRAHTRGGARRASRPGRVGSTRLRARLARRDHIERERRGTVTSVRARLGARRRIHIPCTQIAEEVGKTAARGLTSEVRHGGGGCGHDFSAQGDQRVADEVRVGCFFQCSSTGT